MKKSMIIFVFQLLHTAALFSQEMGNMTRNDPQRIHNLALRMKDIQQSMLENSAAAFDAVFSRLDGMKVDESKLSAKWVFSVSHVVEGVLDATKKGLPLPYGPTMDFLESVYDNRNEREKSMAEVRNVRSVNYMKELLAQIAEKRTAIFGKQQRDFEALLTAAFKKSGPQYLRQMEEGTGVLEEEVARQAGGKKIQVLLFEFEILDELINGLNQAEFNNRGFLQCEVWMNGCSNIQDWDKSINESKIAGCPEIKEARYTFRGEIAQQFQRATNEVLAGFSYAPIELRKTIVDFNTVISYRVYPPGASYSTCHFIFPVRQENGIQRNLNDYSWDNCTYDGTYFVGWNQSSKLDDLLNPVVAKVNQAKYLQIGSMFNVKKF